MIYRTSTYYKIKRIKKRIKVIQGGMGAGKNVAIGQIVLEKAEEKKRLITIMTDTYDNLKDGAVNDFKNLYDAMGLDWDSSYNKTDHDLRHGLSVIQFRYISDVRKQAGKSKRRDILYINEANKIGWEVASTYIGRTHEDIYIDYNPDYEFWAHTKVPELKDDKGQSISEQIIVTYIDNEMIPDTEKNHILSRIDNVEWFRIYGLGQTGFYSERRILNYKFYDQLPNKAMRIPSGMDFGVSPGKTTKIDLYIEENRLYADEVFSLNNLMPERITGAERLCISDKLEEVSHPKGQLIIADSAGATEIKDMRRHGYNIIPVKKQSGEQVPMLNKLRGYDLFISTRSQNLKKAIEEFFWKVDRHGNIIPEVEGHEPDEIVSIRYVIKMKDRYSEDEYYDGIEIS